MKAVFCREQRKSVPPHCAALMERQGIHRGVLLRQGQSWAFTRMDVWKTRRSENAKYQLERRDQPDQRESALFYCAGCSACGRHPGHGPLPEAAQAHQVSDPHPDCRGDGTGDRGDFESVLYRPHVYPTVPGLGRGQPLGRDGGGGPDHGAVDRRRGHRPAGE